MNFTLLGTDLEIKEGLKNYMELLRHYENMATQAKADFTREYEDVLGGVILNSTYSEKFKQTYGSDDYMDGIVLRYVKQTRQLLVEKYGVYTISDTEIWNNAIATDERDVSRLQYEFNNFIIECLKLGENDNQFISRLKKKLSGDYLPSCLYNDIMSLFDYLVKYLHTNNLAEIQFIYSKDVVEAEAIFKNLLETNASNSTKAQLACSLIKLDPRNKAYYEYIFENLPQAKYEISAIASYLHIDISHLIEKDIKRDFNLKTISNENDAMKTLELLQSTMDKFGISTCSRKTELEKLIKHGKYEENKEGVSSSGIIENETEIMQLYLQTDITNPAVVQETINEINENAYVASKPKYLEALTFASAKSINKARKYNWILQSGGIKSSLLKNLGFFIMGVFALLFLVIDPADEDALSTFLLLGVWGGVGLQVYLYMLKKAWNKLTLSGTALHSAITKFPTNGETK